MKWNIIQPLKREKSSLSDEEIDPDRLNDWIRVGKGKPQIEAKFPKRLSRAPSSPRILIMRRLRTDFMGSVAF